jgi:hypothetical protein
MTNESISSEKSEERSQLSSMKSEKSSVGTSTLSTFIVPPTAGTPERPMTGKEIASSVGKGTSDGDGDGVSDRGGSGAQNDNNKTDHRNKQNDYESSKSDSTTDEVISAEFSRSSRGSSDRDSCDSATLRLRGQVAGPNGSTKRPVPRNRNKPPSAANHTSGTSTTGATGAVPDSSSELDAVPAKARNEGGTPVQRTGHESSSLMLPSPGASVSPNNSAGTGKGTEKGTESPRVSEMLVVHDVYDQAFTEHLPKIDRRSSWYKFPPTSIKTSASSFLYRPDIKVRLAGFICCGLMSHVSCLKLLVTCYLFRSVSLLSSAPEILDFPQIYTGTRPYHTHRPSQNEKRLLYS